MERNAPVIIQIGMNLNKKDRDKNIILYNYLNMIFISSTWAVVQLATCSV
jgi:hypothetical protein